MVHLAHVCNLIIDDKYYPIINVIENVKGAKVPRGVARILVLDSSLKVQNSIKDGHSLYCKNDKIFLSNFIMIDGLVPKGNVLNFSDGGKKVVVSEIEPNNFPKQTSPQ